ncbi:MAG TPA: hypothetical protein VMF32_07110 [Xanthobacteraceae bacterium]|nr:hypothetical protein [Xanthobacteraceae bacterium]
MSLTISGVLFTGPFAIAKTVIRRNQDPCVYAVVSKSGQPWDPEYRLIACGDSGDEGHDFSADPRTAGWEQTGSDVSLYLCRVPRDDDPGGARRRELVRQISDDHVPPRNLIGKRRQGHD